MCEHELWNELGNLYFLSGSYKHAVRAYSRAIELHPGAGEPYNNLALAYIQMGKYPEAAEYYQRGIQMLRDELDKAKEKLSEAQKTLRHVNDIQQSHPDLVLNISRVAYQEYAEAGVILRLVDAKKFPEPKELNVPTVPYLLGLADSIGEFRRRALESLRQRKLKEAERCLKIMNEIYSELIALEDAYSLTPELRRKCDIARRLIETTVGDITTETGRNALERSIRQLEKRMSTRE